MRKFLMVAVVALLVLPFGCATNGRDITLNSVQTPLNLDASGQNVFVTVTDKREEGLKPNEVGAVKNGYYITMSHVWANKDAATWVHDTITDEMKRLGATIADKDDGKASRIDVDVTICWASAYLVYSGDVSVIVTLKKDGKTLISAKEYKGSGGNGMNFVAASDGYQKSLETAMLDMLNKLIPDIVTSLKA